MFRDIDIFYDVKRGQQFLILYYKKTEASEKTLPDYIMVPITNRLYKKLDFMLRGESK